MQKIIIHPIGLIHTPHKDIQDMPIQPIAAKGVKGTIYLLPEYTDGLKDIEGFSHITLIYYFHQVNDFALLVVPFMDTEERGIFACKAPRRPNAIGLSTVKLIDVEDNMLHIEEVDILDGTPLIDIKPFYPRTDNREKVSTGWLEQNKNMPVEAMRSDGRFR